ncbi:hypothetical protein N7532_006253 [Penicillium argentinense]|uniref:Uncharacterized protein n=1 Tax=Penicillium argentinense TaxID=1131581 RepID=A0A9W9FFK0_9EURO|nr:uncharacterized protein N7532_006253 [Penicillium argentinense]KAJ5099252.1 hypothetical protein N7532_006253 [Penicillium argentinense]
MFERYQIKTNTDREPSKQGDSDPHSLSFGCWPPFQDASSVHSLTHALYTARSLRLPRSPSIRIAQAESLNVARIIPPALAQLRLSTGSPARSVPLHLYESSLRTPTKNMPHAHHIDSAMRHAHVRREVVPAARLPLLVPSSSVQPTQFPSLMARDSESTSSSCSSGGHCEKPTSNLTTTVLPVVLGAGVPVLCAIVVLIFLHRRHVKKLMREDANDKHKSLDFGMDMDPVGGRRKKHGPPGPDGMPQMMEPSHTKGGMSIDMMHPYLLPPGLHGSHDSLHSMSRSIDDDKYRPSAVGAFSAYDNASMRSHPRPPRDDASSFAGSTTRFGGLEEPKSGLLQNAQRMSRSSPPLYKSPSPESVGQARNQSPQDHIGPVPGLTRSPEHEERGLPGAIGSTTTDRHDHSTDRAAPYPESNTTSLHFDTDPHHYGHDSHDSAPEDRPNFPLPDPPSQRDSEHAQTSMQLPRISLPASDITASDYGEDRHERRSSLMIPAVNVHGADELHKHEETKENKLPELPEEPPQNLDAAYDSRRDTRRLTLGVRPLPPEDPADNPEQRANRIRSFYKEYFDDSKRETTYYEDYGPEFYDGGGGGYAYDPTTGDYYDAAPPPPMPFAEPMGRAARHMATNSAGYNGFAPPPRAFSSASGAFGGGPRAFSSASGRMPGPRGPRRPMPPPAPLQILPTPHMLKDDSIMMAAEFAPGKNFRDQASGRPETPTGGMRPFSPGMRAHTPLASAFDELAAIPSPHALRKSGTFTSLDFAPPPRFKNEGPASDAGSIRSNRTGISNVHMNNVRMGNYRVSRLPPDMVGTKDDLMASLKPDWDMKR